MQLVAVFDSCKNMLADIENINPDIVLMDIDMPLITGIDAVKLLRTKYPALPVLMLTGFEDDDKVFASLCAGANGYNLKNANMQSLIQYIHEVYHGGAPMTPVIARKVLTQFAKIQPVKQPDENYTALGRKIQTENVIKNALKVLVKITYRDEN